MAPTTYAAPAAWREILAAALADRDRPADDDADRSAPSAQSGDDPVEDE